VWGQRIVQGYSSKHGEDKTLPLPDQLVGIELEIEGFSMENEQRFGGISFTEDGSLRNTPTGRGIEAITLPIKTKHVPALLSAFFNKYGITPANYSDRCSTHVHFNIQPLTWMQVATICLLYQTTEKLLFDYIGNGREEGIYCVPWYQSGLSYSIASGLETERGSYDVFRRWQKYSALNLIPATTQGTMEFRHMEGTCNIARITEWIGIISQMFKYAQEVPLDVARENILNMNTVSNYREWMQEVFGKYSDCLSHPGFERSLSIGVIDTKLMLHKEERTIPSWRAVPLDPLPLQGGMVADVINNVVGDRNFELGVNQIQPMAVDPFALRPPGMVRDYPALFEEPEF
jgi:hypothetical protein